MIKEELYIVVDGERVQLDLPQPSGITMKWTSNLFNDLSKLTCSYSYTFKLPRTAVNSRALAMADDIRSGSGIFHKSVSAEFYVNGVCLCPNANLYISESSDELSCVMTWRVLKGFETLKDEGLDLCELPSLGKIWWGNDETYGGTDSGTSNSDSVVYPDYDAGVPHTDDYPPKPCVPVYKLIEMINEYYGVKFDLGTAMDSGMGMLPWSYLNNSNYYGKRVYDDYISHGVIPLTGGDASNSRYTIKGVSGIGSHNMYFKYLETEQRWDVAVFGSGASKYLRHYAINRGYYTGVSDTDSEALDALYREPTKLAMGVAVLDTFVGNKYIKPVYSYQHDTGLSFFKEIINVRKEREAADTMMADSSTYNFSAWASRTYTGVEEVCDELGTSQPEAWTTGHTGQTLTEDTSGVTSYNYNLYGSDDGTAVGIIGWHTSCAFTLKGSCTLHISKAAVEQGRVDVSSYMWISVAKLSNDYDYKEDDAEDQYELEIESVTDADIDEYPGCQSLDIPEYDEDSGTYVCHFDFGQTYEQRAIEIDSDDDEELQAYVLLPYIHEDYEQEVTVTTEDYVDVDDDDEDADDTETEESASEETVVILEEGDLYFEGLVIESITPDIEVAELPVYINVTESLPEISCYDFIKSVFYLNGAMPRVERDGETISAMYYNQLRDRVNDGEALDWSDKLLTSDGEPAESIKYHNTSFAQSNFLEMDYSTREMTDEEIADELDVYNSGYGTIAIDDDTLDDDDTPFTSVFYPAYIQNMRYPLIVVGNTCKVWEGDGSLAEDVGPIYGVMVYRTIDPTFEDATVTRPDLDDIYTYHKRMDILSPFDDEDLFEKLFGYLQTILNNYFLVKEKMLLTEIDLRDFDESVPVYLRKYNAYFAVSTIQRDDEGVSTVELVRLPRAESAITSIDTSYDVEIVSAGTVTFDTGESDPSAAVYVKSTSDAEWAETDVRSIEYGDDSYYAVTADSSAEPVLRVFCAPVGNYTYTYTDPNTGEEVVLTRSEAYAYWDDQDWETSQDTDSDGVYVGYHSIQSSDAGWHTVKIVIPIRNQYDEIIETRSWVSPLFVNTQETGEAEATEARYTIELTSALTKLTMVHSVETTTGTKTAEIIPYPTSVECDDTLTIPDSNGAYATAGYSSLYNRASEGDTYTLTFTVPNTLSYTITKYVGTKTEYTESLSVKLRTYLDDERVLEDTTLTIDPSNKSYHILKFIADIVDADGEVVEEMRRLFVWWEYKGGAWSGDFGDEHDDDATVTATGITISGDAKIGDYDEHYYEVVPVPTYADVSPESMSASVSGDIADDVTVTVDGTEGVVLQTSTLPAPGESCELTVVALLGDEELTATTDVLFTAVTLYMAGTVTTVTATGGEGSTSFVAHVMPLRTAVDITGAESDTDGVTCTYSGSTLKVVASGLTASVTATITVTATYNGIELTGTASVTFEYEEARETFIDVDTLDAANVLIVDKDGQLYDLEEWQASGLTTSDCEGIAVSDGTHRVIMSVDEDHQQWGEMYLELDDIGDTEDDYDGEGNTASILEQAAGWSDGYYTEKPYSSAAVCAAYTFPSGAAGYLPAVGELMLLGDYITVIDEYLEAVGSETMSSKRYWSSSVIDDGTYSTTKLTWYATTVLFSSSGSSWSMSMRWNANYLRPFRSVYVDEE